MGHLLKFVLNVTLDLQNAIVVLRVVDLRRHFACLLIHAGLQQALRVVEFVVRHVREELCELVVHLTCCLVVLNVKIAVAKQTQSCAVAGCKLQLVLQN